MADQITIFVLVSYIGHITGQTYSGGQGGSVSHQSYGQYKPESGSRQGGYSAGSSGQQADEYQTETKYYYGGKYQGQIFNVFFCSNGNRLKPRERGLVQTRPGSVQQTWSYLHVIILYPTGGLVQPYIKTEKPIGLKK